MKSGGVVFVIKSGLMALPEITVWVILGEEAGNQENGSTLYIGCKVRHSDFFSPSDLFLVSLINPRSICAI